MTTWDPRANDLFLKAVELRSPGERQQYLDEACAGDPTLRAEVEALLEASARAGSFYVPPLLVKRANDFFSPTPFRRFSLVAVAARVFPFFLSERRGDPSPSGCFEKRRGLPHLSTRMRPQLPAERVRGTGTLATPVDLVPYACTDPACPGTERGKEGGGSGGRETGASGSRPPGLATRMA